jgi:hypothetical protein
MVYPFASTAGDKVPGLGRADLLRHSSIAVSGTEPSMIRSIEAL